MSESDIDYKLTLKCPLPFNSLYYDMYDNVGPCNLNPLMSARPVKDYLKSDSLLQIRNDMLNEVPTPGHCTDRCYKYENMGAPAQRFGMMQAFPDQSIYDTPKIQHIEVRFTNLCNCKCRICNSRTSSSIASEEKKYGSYKGSILVYTGETEDFVLNEVKQQIDDLQVVTFSGGEPMLQWQHWEFLDHLIENNKKPDLYYYSNGSIISFKGTHITEKWKHFNKILYRVSIDVSGSAVEYWRPGIGADWNTIANNIKYIKENTDNVEICYVITLAWPTLFRIGELLEDLEKIDIGDFGVAFNPQWEPKFSIQNLPPEFKNKAREYLQNIPFFNEVAPNKIQLSIKEKTIRDTRTILNRREKLQDIISYLDGADTSNIMAASIKYLKQVDIRRNQSFIEVFPEYKELAEKYGY